MSERFAWHEDDIVIDNLEALEGKGHPFHGNQWTTLYHGTKVENAATILKEGIRPTKFESVTPYAWASTSYPVAKKYAGKNGVVLVIKAPRHSFTLHESTYGNLSYQAARFTETVPSEWVQKVRHLGGLGSGNFSHAGRPGKLGGSADESAEAENQRALSKAQTNVLAHPLIVFGDINEVHGTRDYIAAYGKEYTAQPLPADIEMGKPHECYKNATNAMLWRDDLTYAEGYVHLPKSDGLAVLHAWAVDKEGKVYDNTLKHPEENKYFGIEYDHGKYLKYLLSAKIYGVLGSTDKNAERAVRTGGRDLR